MSRFLELHNQLAGMIAQAFPGYNIAKTEAELLASEFPTIGIFLGVNEFSRETTVYVPVSFYYILCVFDVYDFDNPPDLASVQHATFSKMEEVIREFNFELVDNIEPIVSVGTDVGSFVTGWSTAIKYNP